MRNHVTAGPIKSGRGGTIRSEELLLLSHDSRKEVGVKTRVFRLGKDLSVYIPKSIACKANLREGDWVEIEVVGRDHLQVHHENAAPTLEELVAQITPKNRYPEV